jgi:hypothetical protein
MQRYFRMSDVTAKYVFAEEVNSSGSRQYVGFDSLSEAFDSIKSHGFWHEVLQYPGRLVFDIDRGNVSCDEIVSAVKSVYDSPENYNYEVIEMKNSENFERRHVIVHVRTVDAEVLCGNRGLNAEIAKNIFGADLAIYQRNRTLRMPLMHKYGKTDYYPIPEGKNIYECLNNADLQHSHVLHGILESACSMVHVELGNEDSAFINWIRARVPGVEPYILGNGKVNLRRISPSMCVLCKREHTNIDLLVETTAAGKVWLKCPRNSAENVPFGGKRAHLLGIYYRNFNI